VLASIFIAADLKRICGAISVDIAAFLAPQELEGLAKEGNISVVNQLGGNPE